MNASAIRLPFYAVLATGLALSSGCAAFRAKTTEVDPNANRHMDQKYDYSDMRKVSETLAGKLLASPFLSKQAEPPMMIVAGVQNRMDSYVDTKNLTDRIRTMCLQSGKVRFINESRRDDLLKEQGYQAAHATPETIAQAGRQLGAKFMVSGSLTQMKSETPRQVRVSETKLNYYKVTLEVTDVVTGEIVWTDEVEFAREARLPLIGW